MSPARILAPLAVVASAAAVYLIVQSGNASSGDAATATVSTTSTTKKKAAATKVKRTYTVKSGDTLGSIAEKHDLSVDDLVKLNPSLDPNSLTAGQKIKLRPAT